MNTIEEIKNKTYQTDNFSNYKKNAQKAKTKRILTVVLVLAILIVLALLLIGKLSYSTARKSESIYERNDVLTMSLFDKNPLIKDIALLGANSAFTENINVFSQISDEEEDFILNNNLFIRAFGDGLVARYLKKQASSAPKLLRDGVRYFNINAVFHEDTFYTSNRLVGAELADYLLAIMEFLDANTREYVILDFTNIILKDKTYDDFYQYLGELKYNEKTIFDYIYYNSTTAALNELHYQDVIGTTGGIILLLDWEISSSSNKHYYRFENVISHQYDQNRIEDLLLAIDSSVQEASKEEKLIINCAYLTPEANFNTLINWSSLDMASWLNANIVSKDNISQWLYAMPILVVDFADSGKGAFNQKINDIIFQYNQNL